MTVITNSINNKIGGSNSGVTNALTIDNASNTASSQAQCLLSVGGATAGDPYITHTVSGVTSWSTGIDNSASDAYVIAASTALGTTNVVSMATTGEINYPLQPSFLAFLPSTDLNVTGNGTTFTIGSVTALTEVFDQGSDFNTNGTFTAPVTGRYFLCGAVQFQGILSTHTAGAMHIVTSNRTFRLNEGNYFNMFDAGGILQLSGGIFCDMDAADTATLTCVVSNGTQVVDIAGAATLVTQFAGYLVC